MSRKKVLVIGGTGYLGQHLLQSLETSTYDVAFTYHSSPPPSHPCFLHFPTFQLDLSTGAGFDSILLHFGWPNVVVNCGALSVPRVCENDPSTAMAVNAPTPLVHWIISSPAEEPLLIHLSTDQVYGGVKQFYKEDDEAHPVNAYGKSKVAAEELVKNKCHNFAILRSSIIYGPQTFSPVTKSLPIQWIDGVLAKAQPMEFFHDEFRCPVFVKDVVFVINFFIRKWVSCDEPLVEEMKMVLNVGGPDRVSRAQMAETVAKIRGYDASLVKCVAASKVDRGVASPADISMNIESLTAITNMEPTSFLDGVKLTFGFESC